MLRVLSLQRAGRLSRPLRPALPLRCNYCSRAPSPPSINSAETASKIARWSLRLNADNTFLSYHRNAIIATVAGAAMVQYRKGEGRPPLAAACLFAIGGMYMYVGSFVYVLQAWRLRTTLSVSPAQFVLLTLHAAWPLTLWSVALTCLLEARASLHTSPVSRQLRAHTSSSRLSSSTPPAGHALVAAQRAGASGEAAAHRNPPLSLPAARVSAAGRLPARGGLPTPLLSQCLCFFTPTCDSLSLSAGGARAREQAAAERRHRHGCRRHSADGVSSAPEGVALGAIGKAYRNVAADGKRVRSYQEIDRERRRTSRRALPESGPGDARDEMAAKREMSASFGVVLSDLDYVAIIWLRLGRIAALHAQLAPLASSAKVVTTEDAIPLVEVLPALPVYLLPSPPTCCPRR